MDYTTQLMGDSTSFVSADYINLKLKSPSPSPFQDHNTESNGYNTYRIQPVRELLGSPAPADIVKDDDYSYLQSSASTLEGKIEQQPVKAVSKLDIYKSVLALTVGKDKMTKILSYLLNLIKYYLTTTRRFIVDEKNFTNLSINPLQHYRTPVKYLKLLLFLNSTALEKKITILTSNISLFRFALRFGGTPYRIKIIFTRINAFLKSPTIDHFQTVFLNEGFLSEFINFYYGIMDELLLLCKLGVLRNKSLRSFVGRHVDLAWYYDIILNLKQNYAALHENKSKQIQLNIQHQVRQRASQLSKRLVDSIGSSPLRSQILKEFNNKSPSGYQSSIDLELQELKHQEKMIKLDLFKLCCDFICDSVDVFDLKIHRALYLTSGLLSGVSGFSKVWATTERDLQK